MLKTGHAWATGPNVLAGKGIWSSGGLGRSLSSVAICSGYVHLHRRANTTRSPYSKRIAGVAQW